MSTIKGVGEAQSAMVCGCDPGAKHRCLSCANIGGYYGCSLSVTAAVAGQSSGGPGSSIYDSHMKGLADAATLPAPGAPYPLFPESAQGRKDHPVFTGVLMYFPDAIAAVAHVSKLGNDQHNPGQPLH